MNKWMMMLFIIGMLKGSLLVACDACGCSVGGNALGVMNLYRDDYFRFGYQQSSFSSVSDNKNNTRDDFHTLALSLRYHLQKRLIIQAYQPYQVNRRQDANGSFEINGLGDTRLTMSYVLMKDALKAEDLMLYLEIGAGVKLPVGAYDARIHERELPENFNTGQGSYGVLAVPNLVFEYDRSGVMVNGNFLNNAPTENGYVFGMQLFAQVAVYREMKINENWTFTPHGGLFYEWLETDEYSTGLPVSGTGGEGTYLFAGFNMVNKKWLAGLTGSRVILQDYASGNMENRLKIAAQAAWLF